ncbi:MAG: CPBP family intramembrane metalloprotease [Flavobacteriaceae bacterium]|nr:CPBP family intramembrane metalloprotease [Flavobacteriaceae bacterium]
MEQTKINRFLENDLNKRLPFAWYLLGSMIVIIFSFVGQFPMLFFASEQSTATMDPKNPMSMFAHLDANLLLFLILFSFFIAFLGFLIVLKKMHRQSFVSVTTARTSIDIKRFFFGFIFWGGVVILTVLVDYFIFPQDYEITFQLTPFLIMFAISVIFIPIQSGLEEYLFRGYLMQGFAKLTKNRWMALMLTSIIFGLLHIFNPEVEKLGMGILFYYIGTGFFFGIMTLMDEGIELAVGFHVANNLLTALLVTADWTVFQTNSILKDISEPSLWPQLIAALFLMYPICLFVLARKYGWSNWKYKLTATINES